MVGRRRDPARGRGQARPSSVRPGAADTDRLTGIAARHELERILRGIARAPAPAAALLVDVVGLKAVNEESGFSAGDALVRRAADRLRGAARTAAIVARIGGDELGALFIGPDARRDADEACRSVRGGDAPRLRAGWVEVRGGETPAELLDRLYAACRAAP